MFKKFSFNQRLTIYLFLVFIIFSFLMVLLQYNREKDFRKRQLENTLDNITELTHKYIQNQDIIRSQDYLEIDSLRSILPVPNIRISLIDTKGVVKYDSEVSDVAGMENHLKRPELQLALRNDFGSNIRSSSTTGHEYFYFSRFYNDYYIRSAALYDVKVQDFMKAEKTFIFYLISICFLTGLILILITNRLSKTIIKLKDFALAISQGRTIKKVDFPTGELGIVSSEIVNIYNQLTEARDGITVEKNKLYNHLHALNEGVAFFSSTKEKLFTNNHFIHFLNHISEKSSISPEEIFSVEEMAPLVEFIEYQIDNEEAINPNKLPKYQIEVYRNNKYFVVTCFFFEDKNFEIVIKDISKLEKRKLLKQQMTSNIAHELKTPAATILGYLETLDNNDLKDKKKQYFIEKAYAQAKKLSELLEDLSTLNKIGETKNSYTFEKISINEIVSEVEDNLQLNLEKKNIKTEIKLPEKLIINGNKSLLFSVFYNLYDNAIKYGGEDIKIIVDNYLDENDFLHFSFANTGNVIEENHLSRIFERFYRVDTGRSRRTGGTGLGLAIVKNAIQLHGGNISARGFKEGGVEFLFTLGKK